ncbi:MAG: polysaccharide deacetylase family protein [Deltaproteobacteria bacterium]
MKFLYVIKFPGLLGKLFPSLITRIPVKQKSVFLTFDDGPIPEVTPLILDILAEYGAKSTFFCLGKNVEKYPHIYESIKNAGHSVGNHSFDHKNGWRTKNEVYYQNIERAGSVIDSGLFRPPYGKIKPSQIKYLKSKYKIVMWDVLSGDFDPETDREKCVNNVVRNVKPGSVIVFHDSLKAKEKVLYSLPLILDELKKKEYKFEPIRYL